jgi:hypothetical protein
MRIDNPDPQPGGEVHVAGDRGRTTSSPTDGVATQERACMLKSSTPSDSESFTAILYDVNDGDEIIHVTAGTPEEAIEKALQSFLDVKVKPELHTTYREYHLAWVDHLFRGKLEDLALATPRA